jgi:hypothetical protein
MNETIYLYIYSYKSLLSVTARKGADTCILQAHYSKLTEAKRNSGSMTPVPFDWADMSRTLYKRSEDNC